MSCEGEYNENHKRFTYNIDTINIEVKQSHNNSYYIDWKKNALKPATIFSIGLYAIYKLENNH